MKAHIDRLSADLTKPINWKRFLILAVLPLVWLLSGCGGDGAKTNSSSLAITVNISPTSVTVVQGSSLQFNATVTGSANTAVTWSVREPAGGSITNSGLYTAPTTTGTFHVIAASQADPSKRAVATVIVATVAVSVSISPSSVTMAQGGIWWFIANVTGSPNIAVTWRVQEPAGGSITNGGIYTTPTSAGTFHVIATSQADPTKTATATVTVTLTSGGRFASTGNMATARLNHTATLLSDGRVLVAGGFNEPGGTLSALSSAELFDPPSGTFSATGAMNHPRGSHSATLLNDGTVLIAGGFDTKIGPVTTAEIYDPATRIFYPTGDLLVARSSHTATKLTNGTVLIAGGFSGDDFQPALGTAEIYDPATGAFTSAGQLQVPRLLHSASLLPNGQVLLAGGFTNANNGQATFSAELYDPSTGMFFVTGNMTSARGRFVASVLPDGKVLVAGGQDDSEFLATAEVYDPGTGSFFAEGAMNVPRSEFAGVTLQDGTVLVCGGSGYSPSAELFNPATGTFAATGIMSEFRSSHTATLLADGRVLVTGGWDNDGVIVSTAELYTP